jgi:hypothetical protein
LVVTLVVRSSHIGRHCRHQVVTKKLNIGEEDIGHHKKIKGNTITMTATSAAAAAADTQRQTLPLLGMTPLTPPVKKNGILWPSPVGVRVCQVDESSCR